MVDAKREGLYFVDRPGAAPTRIGRKGAGPGEYMRASGFGWLGDTLWVSDDGTKRLTFVEQLGRGHVRTQGFVGAVTARGFMTTPIALTPEGAAITGILNAKPSPIGMAVAPLEPLARIARSGSGAWDTLMLLDARHRRHAFNKGGGHWTATQPMSDATLWAISRNGKYAVKVDRADDAPLQNRAAVTLLSTRGTTIYTQRFAKSAEAVSNADVEAIVQREVDVYKRASKPAGMPMLPVAEFRETLYRPKYRVAFTAVVVGEDGSVLLRGNDWSTKTVTYTWITPVGTVRGTFTVPTLQHVRAVSGDMIWSVVIDDDGVGTLIHQRAP